MGITFLTFNDSFLSILALLYVKTHTHTHTPTQYTDNSQSWLHIKRYHQYHYICNDNNES